MFIIVTYFISVCVINFCVHRSVYKVVIPAGNAVRVNPGCSCCSYAIASVFVILAYFYCFLVAILRIVRIAGVSYNCALCKLAVIIYVYFCGAVRVSCLFLI